LHALAADLTAAHKIQTRVIAVDFTTPNAFEIVENRTSDLDVGVAVLAAGFGHAEPFLDSPLHSQLDMIAVNVTAVTALTHSVGQRMAARGSGAIVLFTAWLARRPRPSGLRRDEGLRAGPRGRPWPRIGAARSQRARRGTRARAQRIRATSRNDDQLR
jgi:NAD(P)-dependent dehydrogenase (short-subunit alcohol dehydrogenase family)